MKMYTSPEFKANLFEIEENIMDASGVLPNVNQGTQVVPGGSNDGNQPESWGN